MQFIVSRKDIPSYPIVDEVINLQGHESLTFERCELTYKSATKRFSRRIPILTDMRLCFAQRFDKEN